MLVGILLFFVLNIDIFLLFRLFNYTDGSIEWVTVAIVLIIITFNLIIFNDNAVLLLNLVFLNLFVFNDMFLLIFKEYLMIFLLYLDILLLILYDLLISCIYIYHRLCTWNFFIVIFNFIFYFILHNLTNFSWIRLFI